MGYDDVYLERLNLMCVEQMIDEMIENGKTTADPNKFLVIDFISSFATDIAKEVKIYDPQLIRKTLDYLKLVVSKIFQIENDKYILTWKEAREIYNYYEISIKNVTV